MLRLNSEITIGNLKFNYVTNLQRNSSWENLTDTATIELPSKITNKDNEFIKDIIQVNDEVTIKVGYHPNLVTRFTGYVARVVPESPLKVICEDEAFQLKQSAIRNYSKRNLTLETLITDNYSGEVNIVDANVGAFRIDGVSMVKVLQELKSKYGIFSWFRDGVLNSGLAFNPGEGETQEFKFQRNIIDGSSLIYTKADDLNTISHGISTQPDGSKIELFSRYKQGTTGEIETLTENPGGDLNTLRIPNQTKAQLTELIERRLPNLYYTGYRGSFTTFGEPIVKHGDIASLEDLKFPERSGDYIIKSVMIDFGQNGYRQIIELDQLTNL